MIEGHGDDLHHYARPITANFSSNLTRWIDASPLCDHLREAIDNTLAVYPEPRPYTLEARLADRLGLSPAQVCVTNGATEAIYLIAHAFAGERSLVLQPTFSEYADACRLHGHQTRSLYRLPSDGRLPSDTRMLWMCNPNNPTGSVADKDALAELVRRHADVLFVIDQSYEAFTARPLLSAAEAAAFPNVLIIHSLTKRYAIPGLRIGYLTGAESLLRRVRECRMPWAVNGLAIAAGLFIADHPAAIPFNLPACLAETARLCGLLLTTSGVEPWETDTHFFLARLRMGTASALKEWLANEHGILIRDASNFEGLDSSFFRVSTQLPADNDRLVRAIAQWLTL